MATVFLDVPGVKGDVKAGKFSGQITVLNVNQGSSRSIRSAVNSSKNREKSVISVAEVTVCKNIDPASNELWLKAFKDGALGKCKLSYVRTADGQEAYRTMDLDECIISGFIMSSPAGTSRPLEYLTLNFVEIQQAFTGTSDENQDTSVLRSGYNLAEGQPA